MIIEHKKQLRQRFTFYYIYIKTGAVKDGEVELVAFTFYYIYIKTHLYLFRKTVFLYLHSTIFILKQRKCIYY